MSFTVTANNNLGAIRLEWPTMSEAFDLARNYRTRGYEAISVTNIVTGETFAEHDIVENRLPAEPFAKL